MEKIFKNKSEKKSTIFVVGGGSGGHLFPAVSLGEELIARDKKVILITDIRCTKYLDAHNPFKVYLVSSGHFKNNIFQKVSAAILISLGIMKSIWLILKKRPKVVVGFGGYPTFPTLCAAKIMRIPIILHEQNSFLGNANYFFARDARKIAISFEDTKNIPESCQNKLILTGNPVRKTIKTLEIPDKYSGQIDQFRIFVFGGSQGAKFFTNLIPNVVKMILQVAPGINLHIVQQAPKADWKRLKRVYRKLNVEFELNDFFHDMPEKYKNTHLAISRSGASTISEFIAIGQPAIFIPFPYAAHRHQLLNAQHIERQKGGWYYEQSVVTPEILAAKIIELASRPNILKFASDNLKKLIQNSDEVLADVVEQFE